MTFLELSLAFSCFAIPLAVYLVRLVEDIDVGGFALIVLFGLIPIANVVLLIVVSITYAKATGLDKKVLFKSKGRK
jgi:hypothetical protein